jgi:murein DD-endopeptidase MepM/ murein hydrolase activator NlpD
MRNRFHFALSTLCVPAALLAAACAEGPDGPGAGVEGSSSAIPESPLPDSSGWGTHILAVAVAPDSSVWVGTYGDGIYVSRDGSGAEWEHITSGDSASISWDFVNSFAFSRGEVWYGTIGNGWGLSRDGGQTWENWTFGKLGPRWQYVVPDGIRAVEDTVYIATADGLRVTTDDGETYRDVAVEPGVPNKYLLSLDVRAAPGVIPAVSLTHLRGLSESGDGGRHWTVGIRVTGESARRLGWIPPREEVCAATELTRRLCDWRFQFRTYPDPGGEVILPSEREHFWFERPVGPQDNPHLDQTYTYGSTMGGNFQQHQGVEFNVPAGTEIRAGGPGSVAFAGEAEAGALTVVIRHDEQLDGEFLWSTYYHNVQLEVSEGDSVGAGDVIALAGNTGRATNDHLHLEIHVTPEDDVSLVVNPEERYPPFSRNPQLWIRPLPATGVIAGRVFDSAGEPVPGARIYGITKAHPIETPFSFAETYEDRANPDPTFGEHFAIGDVPIGEYVLGVEIEGERVFRKVVVEEEKVTEVEFRP